MDTWHELPDWPFTFETMWRLCARIKGIIPPIVLRDNRVNLHTFVPARVKAGWTERPHAHWSYEAHIYLYGKVHYTYEGTQVVGPGNVLLHRPGVRHTWYADEAPTCLVASFSLDPEVSVMETTPWPVWPDLLWEAGLLLTDVQNAQIGWQERVIARMTVLLSRILLLSSRQGTRTSLPEFNPSIATRVTDYLWRNLTEHITLTQIAAKLGVSERSLIRQFREETGETVFQRLQQMRLEQTERLLSETDLPLADIGQRVGIHDSAYLVNWYRQQTQLTPMQFRKKVNANNRFGR